MNNQSQEKFVQFIKVQKSYNGINLVVKDFNLDVSKGEFVTMLGPSGSGKTTCLMMLAGFESVTSGDIFLNKKTITSLPPHKRNIGMVFQNYALFPHMTVSQNLVFPLKARKMDQEEIKQRLNRTLDMVKMKEFANRYPSQLSGGQKQRIALARALIFDAELILMDEPLGALDKQLREHMQYEIKKLHHELGITVIYVTHDQTEALTMSDRIAVFNEGIVQQLSTPTHLYERPESSFVAQFIGENNHFVGVIKSIENNQCKVQVQDTIIEADLGFDLKVGDQTSLSLRPERIYINNDVDSHINKIPAIIKDIIYLGDYIRVITDCLGNELVIKSTDYGKAMSYSKGQEVYLSFDQSNCIALDLIASE